MFLESAKPPSSYCWDLLWAFGIRDPRGGLGGSGWKSCGQYETVVGAKPGIGCAEHPSSLLVLISCPLPVYLLARRDLTQFPGRRAGVEVWEC